MINDVSKKKRVLSCKILVYNVRGLASKALFNDFFEYLSEHDVFVLMETFVMSDNYGKYERFFGAFELDWVSAVRTSALGRAI